MDRDGVDGRAGVGIALPNLAHHPLERPDVHDLEGHVPGAGRSGGHRDVVVPDVVRHVRRGGNSHGAVGGLGQTVDQNRDRVLDRCPRLSLVPHHDLELVGHASQHILGEREGDGAGVVVPSGDRTKDSLVRVVAHVSLLAAQDAESRRIGGRAHDARDVNERDALHEEGGAADERDGEDVVVARVRRALLDVADGEAGVPDLHRREVGDHAGVGHVAVGVHTRRRGGERPLGASGVGRADDRRARHGAVTVERLVRVLDTSDATSLDNVRVCHGVHVGGLAASVGVEHREGELEVLDLVNLHHVHDLNQVECEFARRLGPRHLLLDSADLATVEGDSEVGGVLRHCSLETRESHHGVAAPVQPHIVPEPDRDRVVVAREGRRLRDHCAHCGHAVVHPRDMVHKNGSGMCSPWGDEAPGRRDGPSRARVVELEPAEIGPRGHSEGDIARLLVPGRVGYVEAERVDGARCCVIVDHELETLVDITPRERVHRVRGHCAVAVLGVEYHRR
mmetsp:Transcript_6051/g.14537  ORF Transcript_6051/g.14537 Transcript_6051/m.14537 type:complete len:508 (-) Transcript_6051:4020-5543(-)